MITTAEILCDLFSFLDKDQIERIQLVNQFWNNVIIHHKIILPLRLFVYSSFISTQIHLYATREDWNKDLVSYVFNFDGTNISKENVSSRYSQLTVDEVVNNLNDVLFDYIRIQHYDTKESRDILNMMKLVTMKTRGRIRGRFGKCCGKIFDSKLFEIFDNYFIVDELNFYYSYGIDSYSYIREVYANPDIVQLPSTPKEIRLEYLKFKENDKLFHFIGNGKLNEANRLTIRIETSYTNYGNFIQQWFELYRTHENPISLVGNFELRTYGSLGSVLDGVKTLLNNTQLCVKYNLERFHKQGIVKRRCALHETDPYALVIEMAYIDVIEMSSINASDLDQPPCNKMDTISFCVKSL